MSTHLEFVMPVYNEGANILKTYENLKAALPEDFSWKCFAIYDFDNDTSIPYLQTLQKQDSRVIPLKQNLGGGIVNAFKYGFGQVHDGPVVVIMGDNSDDLRVLPAMYEKYAAGAAVVASSRYSRGGKYYGGSFIKKKLSQLAGFILYISGLGTRDPTNNFKLYCGKFLHHTTIESIGGFEVALELTVKAALQGLKVDEVSGSWKDRVEGVSNFKIIKWMPCYLKWFFYYFGKRINPR
jgi:dolichol-phosphate mannosyltransferase